MNQGIEGGQKISGFVGVDNSGYPQEYVNYLERVSRTPDIKKYKEFSYGLLDIKQGDKIIDLGSGIGEDIRAIILRYPVLGQAIGVDNSLKMVNTAISATPQDLLIKGRVQFQVGDASHLDFPDDFFSSSRSDRTFQHLTEPANALAELVRVTKPGGNIVVSDTDWTSLSVVGVESKAESVVKKTFGAIIINPSIGRDLKGLFKRQNLKTKKYNTQIVLLGQAIQDVLWLDKSLETGVSNGVIKEEEARECLEKISQSKGAESIKVTFNVVTAVGQKFK